MRPAIAFAFGVLLAAHGAEAATKWRWTLTAPNFEASGQLTTADEPEADGFYPILGIEGEANGVAITGLQPARTSIPGNEGWPVDGIVRESEPQLSVGGFGFALADGGFVSPFYGFRFQPPGLLAVITNPGKGERREARIQFKATREP